MKQSVFSILLLALLLGFSATVSAQDDKDEIKEWKKKLKAMDPLAFKSMYEEYQQLKGEAASKDRELSTLRKQIATKESEISAKDVEITELRKQLGESKEEVATKDVTATGDDYTKGVVYKVQVGAFTKATYSEKIEGKFWEEDADGVKKYTIGHFRDYQDATRFKNYLRAIGVSDAWIVAYEDNQRKDIKHFLDTENGPKMEGDGGGTGKN